MSFQKENSAAAGQQVCDHVCCSVVASGKWINQSLLLLIYGSEFAVRHHRSTPVGHVFVMPVGPPCEGFHSGQMRSSGGDESSVLLTTPPPPLWCRAAERRTRLHITLYSLTLSLCSQHPVSDICIIVRLLADLSVVCLLVYSGNKVKTDNALHTERVKGMEEWPCVLETITSGQVFHYRDQTLGITGLIHDYRTRAAHGRMLFAVFALSSKQILDVQIRWSLHTCTINMKTEGGNYSIYRKRIKLYFKG